MAHATPVRLGLVALLLLLLAACFPAALMAATPVGEAWQATPTTRFSPGCAVADTAAQPLAAPPLGVLVDGVERSFAVHVPAGYRPDLPHELVIAFHGRTNANTQVQRYYDLDETMPGALIVYPAALPAGSGFSWSEPGDHPAELRDFTFVDALIGDFAQRYCLDLDRVFVVGHSLGASFANSVACHRPQTVRAVASVAGGIAGSSCDGAVAALLIHHPDDQLVPISEGVRVRDAFISANGLEWTPVPASEPELLALGCERYGPDSPHPVVWCVHDDATTHGGRYYPHNWPDAAAGAIARFFRDLP